MDNSQQQLSLDEGIRACIPNTEICKTTLALAWRSVSQPILNHSLRVYLLSRWLALRDDGPDAWDQDRLSLLFAACICHDIGTSDAYNGPQRFEVEGADAAKSLLIASGVPEPDGHQVWTAIALHTSPGIAERIDPFTRLVRLGVLSDFSAATRETLGTGPYLAEIEQRLPRLEIERVLADAVVCQARETEPVTSTLSWPSSEKHPKGSWPGVLLHAKLQNPNHSGVNPAF